jgi:transcriptional regulator with XRE-family HTH domain
MQLGDKIKKIRDLKGLKQDEVAAKLNISTQAYSKIERNETKVDSERLEQLANIFGISADDIQKFDDRNLFVNNLKEFETANNTGYTVNNYYYGNDQLVSQLEKTIEQQKEMLQHQKEEILYLRKQLEILLSTK